MARLLLRLGSERRYRRIVVLRLHATHRLVPIQGRARDSSGRIKLGKDRARSVEIDVSRPLNCSTVPLLLGESSRFLIVRFHERPYPPEWATICEQLLSRLPCGLFVEPERLSERGTDAGAMRVFLKQKRR